MMSDKIKFRRRTMSFHSFNRKKIMGDITKIKHKNMNEQVIKI